ncbi:hypothetical protein U728_1076 [Clostridium botulinum 202F]|nr:hypothetical protein U728_1076 [Clostridium botulinum 202F]KAI3344359.1 hypothetical protein CIT17_17220 [Clostridium botulinum]KON13537.1 hypothetical protein ACP50_05580 [Clostridium botulinum]MBY6988420.1 hypothetical protein [Clostridium botulinum]NFH02059.1 hypothetical protein [Clostridium botulinum]
MAENILGGRLSIEDNYTSAFQRFANGILASETKFEQFASSVVNSNQKIINDTTKTSQQVDKIAQKFIQKGDSVADAINKANDRVKQNQEKTIEGLAQKYIKLGMNIQDAYSKAEHESNNIWNGGGGSSSGGSGGSDGFKDFAQSFLQSGFGGIIGKLGLIGAGITASIAVMKTMNNWMEQGFGILNKVSDGLFSYDGVKSAVEESMDFETGRMKLNLFYGDEQKGLEAYQNATYEAKKTYASETDTIDITSKLAQMSITPTRDQLEKLLDVAGTRDEVETSHIGLAVKEAIEGRIAMLQMYGINNKNLKSHYDSLKKSNPEEYKSLKGALSKKGTAGDPQKYFNLLASYIEQSPMNGYAETYAKSVKGKLERLEGVWANLKSEIMGIDTINGTAKEGGVFAAVAEMVDNLKDKLEDANTVKGLETIGNSFGSVFTSISNAFSDALEPDTINKVAESITKIGGALANLINNFVNSGQLDKLIDNLPSLVEKVVGNEVINKTTDFQVGADIAQGNWLDATGDWFSGKLDWVYNALGIKTDYGILGSKGTKMTAEDRQERNKNDLNWLNNKFGIPKWLLYSDNPMMGPKLLTDANASTAIDKNNKLSDDEKSKLKYEINNDDKAKYNITIHKVEANNFDEIMNSIKAAQKNRK